MLCFSQESPEHYVPSSKMKLFALIVAFCIVNSAFAAQGTCKLTDSGTAPTTLPDADGATCAGLSTHNQCIAQNDNGGSNKCCWILFKGAITVGSGPVTLSGAVAANADAGFCYDSSLAT